MPSIVSGKPPKNEGVYPCPRCGRQAFVFYSDTGTGGKCQECGFEQEELAAPRPAAPAL